MKECCLHMSCQLRLLLLEIRAPEQTGQGQTETRIRVMKIVRHVNPNKKGKPLMTMRQKACCQVKHGRGHTPQAGRQKT